VRRRRQRHLVSPSATSHPGIMLARPTIFVAGLLPISMQGNLPAVPYVAAADATNARRLERYFQLGSGKAFAKKRLLRGSNKKRRASRCHERDWERRLQSPQ
jgi:hypothetical protein